MNIDQEMVMVIDLANRCPFHEALPECPSKEVRKQPFQKRHDYIRSFTSDQVRWIMDYHHGCSSSRDHSR